MEKIPKMSGVLQNNCCEFFRNIFQKNTFERVYEQEFINKVDAFLEPLQQLLMNKRNI